MSSSEGKPFEFSPSEIAHWRRHVLPLFRPCPCRHSKRRIEVRLAGAAVSDGHYEQLKTSNVVQLLALQQDSESVLSAAPAELSSTWQPLKFQAKAFTKDIEKE